MSLFNRIKNLVNGIATQAEYEKALGQLAQLENAKRQLEAQMKTLRDDTIKPYVLTTRNTLHNVPGVDVSITDAYTRPKWDTVGLREYSVKNPEILQFLGETHIAENVRISVQK